MVYPDFLKAQTFNFDSGSSGLNGEFPPSTVSDGTTNITVNMNNGEVAFLPDGTVPVLPGTTVGGFSDGIFNFTTFNLASEITLSFINHVNNPIVTIVATGDITIDGIIDVNGKKGESANASTGLHKGGDGGPGGFNGGNGSIGSLNFAGAGVGPGGGSPGIENATNAGGGVFGAANEFATLIPQFGGSGGGGGSRASGGGGGGAGAILISSSTVIVLNGEIQVNGGTGGDCPGNLPKGTGGSGGSGGSIRLVAAIITGTGLLSVNGGGQFHPNCSLTGGSGRVRIEALINSFSWSVSPVTSLSIGSGPGPVTATSNPALSPLAPLTISSVGGINAPFVTTGNLADPDLSLTQVTTNPIEVVLTTNFIPVGTIFTVRVTPQFGNAVDVSSTASVDTGNPGEASASAQVNLPAGDIVTLSAFGDFTVETASLFPMINGEEVDKVMLAANFGEKSQLTFVTKSGKMITPEELVYNQSGRE